ncbi:hypothetical protein MTR_1g031385 [Medicago truncatula]|uniref:Uncharacterized protein n=1 Tax=Medicago truncatula TaxID=3880 RepID=A0A072VEW6_MEDTR|nr:hypothetical protein MTR_1g031385 [Medicago truncatula]
MSVSMSRKPGRAVHAKMRLKQKASNYIWLTTVPLGASAAVNDYLHQKLLRLRIQSSPPGWSVVNGKNEKTE